MTNIKLVVTDIDDTLVIERSTTASAATHEAMQMAQAAGVTVAAATARPYDMARDLFVKLGLSGPSIFDGGASIYDIVTGELLWKNWLSVERLHAIAEIVFPQSELMDFFPQFRLEKVEDVTIADIVESAPYAWCLLRRDMLPSVVEQLKRIGGLNVHPMNGWPEKPEYVDVQITDQKSDKFHGVEALRKLLDLSREETLAIGDGNNDVPLFQAAGVKVAMGNAVPELKVLADYEVAPVEADGWAEAIRRLVLS